MADETLVEALERIWAAEGRPVRDEGDDVLGVLVRMMLGQATSKSNASQAFGELLDRFEGDWEQVHAAPVDDVAAAIEVGGLSNQKAPRIQAALGAARARFGDYTLEPLREWSADDALDFVLSLDGVGPTTGRFTLMAAAGMDVMPVNGGIKRVLARLSVLTGTESDRVVHEKAQAALPVGWSYAAHMTLVRHARTTCQKVPACGPCAASSCCPSSTTA